MQWEREFAGPNYALLVEAYERWRTDPESVDAEWAERFSEAGVEGAVQTVPSTWAAASAAAYADAIRTYGHLAAAINPLGNRAIEDPRLDQASYGLSDESLAGASAGPLGGPGHSKAGNALEALRDLRQVYQGTTGYEFDHVQGQAEQDWLYTAVESGEFGHAATAIDEEIVLERLAQVEAFEQFIHRVFPGKHRFSIEGLDVLVPMLDELVRLALRDQVKRFFLGMSHRGRLNVLAHILCVPYRQILAEFKDPLGPLHALDDLGWTGDVQYHRGASRIEERSPGRPGLQIQMPPNPSHVEAIDPVVLGAARAAITNAQGGGQIRLAPRDGLALLAHGDAAFVGQGISAETLNLGQLGGYTVGGTLHIILNNQLGYTTEPEEGRSTMYASDLAKGFAIPVVHVNADDPLACIAAVRLAYQYRSKFGKDFLIDLVGYRRYGHNEGDEPSFTQPVMYQMIADHPRVADLLADKLNKPDHLDELRDGFMEALRRIYEDLEPGAGRIMRGEVQKPLEFGTRETRVDGEILLELHSKLLDLPKDFVPHPKLKSYMERRQKQVEQERSIDWAAAEQLAWASLLVEGSPIRLTGEDVVRGTFNQRHLAFHDYRDGRTIIPLQRLDEKQAAFEAHNSPLSEEAALAFEYGFDVSSLGHLVIWEAQYGDFINNAQMVIDEFIASGAAKWKVKPSLVLLLPHGLEGAGPDHSSGRIERFLSLSTDDNMRVIYPTTAAQYFHALRRQAMLSQENPLPLIVFTPKGLLRAKATMSRLSELTDGRWHSVLHSPGPGHREPSAVRNVILCTGKIFHALFDQLEEQAPRTALIRIEQLAPFPGRALSEALAQYPRCEEYVWVQEEPENMGAWRHFERNVSGVLDVPLRYVGRPASASPAEGSAAWHAENQDAILERALRPEAERPAIAVEKGSP